MKNLEHPWDAYAALQAQEDRITKISHRERAGDEKLNEFLASVERGDLPNDADAIERKLKNLEINRQRTERRREAALTTWATEQLSRVYFGGDVIERTERMQQVEQVKRLTDHDEWSILWALASGALHTDVAARAGLSPDALRKKVSRLRNHIRNTVAKQATN